MKWLAVFFFQVVIEIINYVEKYLKKRTLKLVPLSHFKSDYQMKPFKRTLEISVFAILLCQVN